MRPKIYKQKKANNEADHEEPTVTDDPVVKEPSYFDILECGKNILNRLDSTREKSCMATPRDKYYMEIYDTLFDYNECNDAPL